MTHLLDAHAHLAVAYYKGNHGLSALHEVQDAIRDLLNVKVSDNGA